MKNHKDSLTDIAISTSIGKAASCGENTIKVHELHDLKDTSNVINIDDERGLVRLRILTHFYKGSQITLI